MQKMQTRNAFIKWSYGVMVEQKWILLDRKCWPRY